MELLSLFLLVPLLCLSLLHLLPKIIKTKSRFNPPGPPGLPFIGNLHQIDRSSLHISLWNLSKSYGPVISLRFGFIPTVVVSSARVAKEVFKTQDKIFCSRPTLLGTQKLSYNGLDVAFSPHNENWKEMRKIFSLHLFSSKKIQSSRYVREDEVTRAMHAIRELALSSKNINLSEIVKSVTSNVMMRVGFGKRFPDEQERKKVFQLLEELQAVLADVYVSDIWPGLPFGSLVDRFMGKMDRLEKCFQGFDSFYQQLIDEHLNPQEPKAHDEEDVIDILLRLIKEKNFNLTTKHIKATLMNVLAGGTDPSTATLIWSMTLLIKNPEIMKKAQEEVRIVIGKKGKVIEDDLPQLTYLKAVITETLRLYPPSPLLLPRETMRDAILHGYHINQKTLVYVNALAIGRDPEFWESPEDFYPERFLGSDIKFTGNDFVLIPFGAGRRICPGISLGITMIELLLANLLYLFDWGLPEGMRKEDIDFDVLPGITMHKRNELCLSAHVSF